MRNGDKGLIRFRFLYYPEFLKEGATIMFREGRTKGLGYVTKVYNAKWNRNKLKVRKLVNLWFIIHFIMLTSINIKT